LGCIINSDKTVEKETKHIEVYNILRNRSNNVLHKQSYQYYRDNAQSMPVFHCQRPLPGVDNLS